MKPEFKNPKVASLYDSWHRVLELSAERRRRLQQTLDRLNEVICQLQLVCHITECFRVYCVDFLRMFMSCYMENVKQIFCYFAIDKMNLPTVQEFLPCVTAR